MRFISVCVLKVCVLVLCVIVQFRDYLLRPHFLIDAEILFNLPKKGNDKFLAQALCCLCEQKNEVISKAKNSYRECPF